MSVRSAWLLLLALHSAPVLAGWRFGWPVGVGCMFFIHTGLLATVFLPRISPWGTALRTFRTEKREVCLTIDDGPTDDTAEILTILGEADVKAVFFLIGIRVAQNPSLCRTITDRGHLLGNHTATHPAGWFWSYPPTGQRREISNASHEIRAAYGQSVHLFRPPAGFRNLFNPAVLRELGLREIGWSARGFDGVDTDVDRVLRRILGGLRPGAIILLHQGMPHHATLLRRLLGKLKEDGWEVVIPRELK